MRSTGKIESMIAMMTFSFYVCWTPYAIKVILELCGIPLSVTQSLLLLVFAKLGVIVNPILYIFYNKEVSNSFTINAGDIYFKLLKYLDNKSFHPFLDYCSHIYSKTTKGMLH